MVMLRKSCDRCSKCGSKVDKPGFEIEDGHGDRVFYCLTHMIEELKNCLLPVRVIGEES